MRADTWGHFQPMCGLALDTSRNSDSVLCFQSWFRPYFRRLCSRRLCSTMPGLRRVSVCLPQHRLRFTLVSAARQIKVQGV